MFAAAIVSDEQKVVVNTDEITVESSYRGPSLNSIDEVTSEWVKSLMEWQKDQKKLHKKFATIII